MNPIEPTKSDTVVVVQDENQPETNGAPTAPPTLPNSNVIALGANGAREPRRQEIYKWVSDKPLYASSWSHKPAGKFRLAVGTLIETHTMNEAALMQNKMSIIQLNEETQALQEMASFPLGFPANCVKFIPDIDDVYPDLIATSGDCLRVWKIKDNTVEMECSMNQATEYCSALTNFDWNEVEPRLMGTSSIDTTCTIYDVETQKAIASTGPMGFSVKTQLIAHDKPVHDIGFSRVNNGRDHFATVGADGSARMFDLRRLEHSTIVYEDPQKTPLMKLDWNKQEPYYLATFAAESNEVSILDIRMPCSAVCRLKNHQGPVNGLAWAPHSPYHICTAGDDNQALIWDVQHLPRPVDDPILAYTAGGEVNQVHWGTAHSNWISICFKSSLEILRV